MVGRWCFIIVRDSLSSCRQRNNLTAMEKSTFLSYLDFFFFKLLHTLFQFTFVLVLILCFIRSDTNLINNNKTIKVNAYVCTLFYSTPAVLKLHQASSSIKTPLKCYTIYTISFLQRVFMYILTVN